MTKRLFSDRDEYTTEGHELGLDAAEVLGPFLRDCVDKGYSMRDVEYIVSQELSCLCLNHILAGREKPF